MGKHFIFQHHEGGFFSNFNKVITHLSYNKPSQITWQLYGQPFGAFAYNCGEVFSKLFKNVIIEPGSHEVQIVKEFLYTEYTGNNTHELYIGNNDWRYNLNKTFNKYIYFTDQLKDRLTKTDEYIKQNKPVIGILKRNQLLKCEQNKGYMPTIEDYCNEINKINDKATIFLSVDNKFDLNFFCNNYNCYYTQDMKRTNFDTDQEPHFTPSTVLDAMNFFNDVYFLSKCEYLIHPVSNMSTAALFLNPKLKSIYI